jgi:formate dehydrogenase
MSGTTLEAQARYAAGVREAIQAFIDGEEIAKDNVIVKDGEIVGGAYAAAYS